MRMAYPATAVYLGYTFGYSIEHTPSSLVCPLPFGGKGRLNQGRSSLKARDTLGLSGLTVCTRSSILARGDGWCARASHTLGQRVLTCSERVSLPGAAEIFTP